MIACRCVCRTHISNSQDDRYGEQKIAQFRTHYLTKEFAYVSTRQSGQVTMDTNLKEMGRIGLIVEYSRMQLPSLSSGCEIAQFFVRYMEDDDSMPMCLSNSKDDDVSVQLTR